MKAYFRFVLCHRIAVLMLCGAVTVLAALSFSRAVVASSVGKLFLGESPAYKSYLERGRAFGNDEILVVGFSSPRVLAPDFQKRVRQVVGRVEKLPGVRRVDSVLNAQRIRETDGSLTIAPYARLAARDPARVPELMRDLRDDPFAARLVISKSGMHTAVIVEMVPDASRPAEEGPTLVAKVLEAFDEAGFGSERLHQTGLLGLFSEVMVQTVYSLETIFPLCALLLLLTVWLMFRRLWPAALSLLVALLAVSWTMGFAVALDRHISILTALAPAVILIVSFSDVVHLCSAYLLELGGGRSKEEAILAAAEDVGRACLYTSMTTFVGFVAMSLVPTPVFRLLGLVLGFGVATALLLAMTVVPVIFSLMREPAPLRTGATARVHRAIDAVLGAMERLATGRPRAVIAGFGVLIALAVVGLTQLHIETDFARRFDDDNPIRQDQAWFQTHFTGSNLVDIYVRAPEAGGLLDAERFERIASFQRALEALPGVDRAYSVVDLIADMHRKMNADAALPPGAVPTSREALAQYLLLFEMSGGEDLDRLLDFERQTLRIAMSLSNEGFRATAALGAQAEQLGRTMLPRSEIEATGLMYLVGDWLDEILAGQRNSLGLSLMIIAVMMIIGLRSIRVGLWSMLPNVIPLLVVGGWLGFAWDNLDSDSLMLGLLAIGIGVDDTIHFLMRYRVEYERRGDHVEAVGQTYGFAGRAIVMTTVILVIGFSPFALSDYVPLYLFGTMLPVCLVVALIADLLLVPALVCVGWARLRDRPSPKAGAPSRVTRPRDLMHVVIAHLFGRD